MFGSLRTAIIAVAEIGVALTLAFFVLGDRLTAPQVVGVGLLIFSMLLIRSTDLLPRGFNPNALLVHDMANVQFQRIAFHRAFGKAEHDNEYGVMSTLTTAELVAIQKMLGATNKPVDPFPMNKQAAAASISARSSTAGTRHVRATRSRKAKTASAIPRALIRTTPQRRSWKMGIRRASGARRPHPQGRTCLLQAR